MPSFRKGNRWNLISIYLSQFGVTVSGNYVTAIMPFFLFSISPYSPRETLIWVGWIMGITHLVTSVASNFWGFLTSRYSPKLLYMRGFLVHTLAFLLMGFTSSFHFILFLRIVQGIMGGVSTIGLILVSKSSSRERISADIGTFQTFVTLGLLTGPPLGSFIAALLGYHEAFLFASAMLAGVLVFCHFNIADVPSQPRQEKTHGQNAINRRSIFAWFLCFSANIQLLFLPSLLPKTLEQFHIEKPAALRWAGFIIMLYTATATLGIFVWTRMARRFGTDRLVLSLVLAGTLFLLLLSLPTGIVGFIVIRMIQTGLIAATVPLVISMFAADDQGATIGFLNSARFAGNACGHILGTSLLAFSDLTTTYLAISALTLISLVAFRFASKTSHAVL